jgi:hypothetical protein
VTRDLQDLLIRARSDQFLHLFQVLVSSAEGDEAMDRFMTGVHKLYRITSRAHDRLLQEIEG